MIEPYRTTLLQQFRAKLARLNEGVQERSSSILAAFDQAEASGVEVSPWLIGAAEQLQRELAEQQAERGRLIAELDRWIEFRAGKALERN